MLRPLVRSAHTVSYIRATMYGDAEEENNEHWLGASQIASDLTFCSNSLGLQPRRYQ